MPEWLTIFQTITALLPTVLGLVQDFEKALGKDHPSTKAVASAATNLTTAAQTAANNVTVPA
jgi:hypothetical protein